MSAVRSVRGNPWNGFVRSELVHWTGGFPMADLVRGELHLPMNSASSKAGVSEPVRKGLEGRIYLAVGDRSPLDLALQRDDQARHGADSDGVAMWVEEWTRAGFDVLLQVSVFDLPRLAGRFASGLKAEGESRGSVHLALDALSLMARGGIESCSEELRRLLEAVPAGVEASLLLPLLGGLATEGELQPLLEVARDVGLIGAVPIEMRTNPKGLRAIVEYAAASGYALTEQRIMRLFHSEPPSRRDLSERVARSGIAWWIEPAAILPADRTSRCRFVSAQLALVAELGDWLGLGTGFVEGHLQASRRIESLPHDVVVLVREGNLKVFGWLDRRAKDTMTEWFSDSADLSGPPPALTRLRARFVANSHLTRE